MICPQCRLDFWALFICDDGVYRCRADRDARPVVTVVKRARETAAPTAGLQRPYATRRGKG